MSYHSHDQLVNMRLTVSACTSLPIFVINNAGKNKLTPTCEISFEALSLSSRNCAAATPAEMVSKTAIDACRAPKKGTR